MAESSDTSHDTVVKSMMSKGLPLLVALGFGGSATGGAVLQFDLLGIDAKNEEIVFCQEQLEIEQGRGVNILNVCISQCRENIQRLENERDFLREHVPAIQ